MTQFILHKTTTTTIDYIHFSITYIQKLVSEELVGFRETFSEAVRTNHLFIVQQYLLVALSSMNPVVLHEIGRIGLIYENVGREKVK